MKTLFDPREVFNPGNVVGPDPRRPAWPLRRQMAGLGNGEAVKSQALSVQPAESQATNNHATTPLLLWKPGDFQGQIAACHGCGDCRTQQTPQRMCPIFRATRAEEATPRAKANLLRDLLRNGADSRRLADADVRAVADLCVNCKMWRWSALPT